MWFRLKCQDWEHAKQHNIDICVFLEKHIYLYKDPINVVMSERAQIALKITEESPWFS